MVKVKCAWIISLFVFLFLPARVFAQVVINEVMWMGSSKSARDEWIELKNISGQKIQLNGWRIDNLLEKNGTFTFPGEPTIEIAGGGFLLVSYYSKADRVMENTTILDNPGLVWRCKDHPSCSTFSLANSGNGDLVLRNSEGEEIDRVIGSSWPAGKKENGICFSMERVNLLVTGSNPNNWKTAAEAKNLTSGVFDKATPEGENSTPTPTEVLATATPPPTPTNMPAPNSYEGVYISEFMAWPDSGNEWIELFNNNDSEVNLNGWYVDDVASSGQPPFPISGAIPAKSYKQFFIKDSYFNNNNGDDARLLDGDQTEKDKKSFTTSTKGKSWSKDTQGDWCQMDPTPNSTNSECPNSTVAPTLSPTPTINLTLTPTPKTTLVPSPSLNASISGEILGEETISAEGQLNVNENDLQPTIKAEIKQLALGSKNKYSWLFPLVVIGGGLGLVSFSVYSLLKPPKL